MNFFNNPANNGLKVLLLTVVLAGAGAFAYQVNKNDALLGTGQVASTSMTGRRAATDKLTTSGTTGASSMGTTTGTTGGTTSGTSGTTTGGSSELSCDTSTTLTLIPSADLSFTPGPLHFDTSVQDGGHFVLRNPTPCQVKVTMISFEMLSTYPAKTGAMVAWQPIGGITPNSLKLHAGSSIVGTPLFGTALRSVSVGAAPSFIRTMAFTSTAGITIPAYGTQPLALEVSSWNMQPPGTVAFKLHAFKAVKVLTGASLTWLQPTTILPTATTIVPASVVTAGTMVLVNP
jgi:hypothetical protein